MRSLQNGIPFANAVANVAFNTDNKVVAFGSSFVKHSMSSTSSLPWHVIYFASAKIASSTPSVSFDDAKKTAETALDGTYLSEIPSTIEYFAKDDGSAVLVHALQIRNEEAGTWYNAFVDAHSNTLVSVTDYVAKASVSRIMSLIYIYAVLICSTVSRSPDHQGGTHRGIRDRCRPR